MPNTIHVIAHRGASGVTGEGNTLRSFGAAIELGCDYVEFDVRRTRDELVCFHDACIDGVPVDGLTLGELRKRSGKAVPTLAEVVRLCRGRIGLDVEIKAAGLEDEIVSELRPARDDTPLLVKSFDVGVVAKLAGMGLDCPVGLLADAAPRMAPDDALRAAIAAGREAGADFLAPHYRLLNGQADMAPQLDQLPLYPWTVNDAALMAQLLRRPIRGLITDRPDLLLQQLGRRA